MDWKPHLGTRGPLHENDWHPKMCHESSLPTKTLENRRYSNRLLIFVWLLSNSEPQALLTLESVPSVSGRGRIPINRLPGFPKQRTISVFQLENTSDWVPSFLLCLLSSHILANIVRRLFTFDERHEEPGTVRATWEKVPHDVVVYQSPSAGGRRCLLGKGSLRECHSYVCTLSYILCTFHTSECGWPCSLWNHVHNMQNGCAGKFHGNRTRRAWRFYLKRKKDKFTFLQL